MKVCMKLGMKKLYKIVIVLLFVINTCNAVVYKMDLWKDDKGNTVILLSDWHSDTLSVTTTFRQKREIIDLANHIHAYGIFEDVGWYTGNSPEIIQALKKTRRLAYLGQKIGWLIPSWIENNVNVQTASPLFDITVQAKNAGVECESIEFRYAGLWAKLGYNISVHDIYQELTSKIKEIQEYQNGQKMKAIYDGYLEIYFNINQKFLDILKQEAQNPQATLASLPDDQQYRIETYAHSLVDIEILHALHRQLDTGKKTFLIYAGRDHINSIELYGLKLMGFEQKASIGQDVVGQQLSDQQERELIKKALNISEVYKELHNIAGFSKEAESAVAQESEEVQ